MAENEKRRLSQLEEQLSNTLSAVDSLHADVATFKEYAVENNKVVNGMLNKMDETQDMIKDIVTEMVAERKQRNLEIDTINRRLDRLENQ
ncbi:MAG: hypothetical protein R8G66_29665 [Cytophagales bacterium]|nr:hypothetical protein [Cytophagales bacterium]